MLKFDNNLGIEFYFLKVLLEKMSLVITWLTI